MTAQVSAPVSTTVVAVDVIGLAGSPSAPACFVDLVHAAGGIGYVTTDDQSKLLTLTLAPESPVGETLQRVAAAAAAFDDAARPARSRAVVHFGTVFRTEDGGTFSFKGSAIRSTQSILRRAPESAGWFATRDFVQHAGTLGKLPFSLTSLNGTTIDGLSALAFGAGAVVAATSSVAGASLSDPALIAFLKKRLAEDVGPFAGPLVDRGLQSSTAIDVLVPLLGSNIDQPARRAKFESDVRARLEARNQA